VNGRSYTNTIPFLLSKIGSCRENQHEGEVPENVENVGHSPYFLQT
jgi:hypothetical protein